MSGFNDFNGCQLFTQTSFNAQPARAHGNLNQIVAVTLILNPTSIAFLFQVFLLSNSTLTATVIIF